MLNPLLQHFVGLNHLEVPLSEVKLHLNGFCVSYEHIIHSSLCAFFAVVIRLTIGPICAASDLRHFGAGHFRAT